MRCHARDGVRFKDFTLLALLICQLGALVGEREWRFAGERKDNFGLVAYIDCYSAGCIVKNKMTLTLVNVLHDALAMSDLRRRQLVHLVAQVCHTCLAHLLLMGNRRDGELARLLLDEGEGRHAGLLSVGLPVDLVSMEGVSMV